MSVCLMTNVPHKFVERKVEYVVNGHRKFHNAEAGSKMSGIVRQCLNNEAT